MDIKIIKNLKELKKYKEVWDKLVSKDLQTTFYQSFDYIYLWAKYNLNQNSQLKIYLIYNNNQLVAIAPFYIEARKKAFLSWTELKFMGMGDYRVIICDDSLVNRKTVYRLIITTIEDLANVDRILLTNIPDNNDFLNYLLSSEQYNLDTTQYREIPIVDLRAKDKISPDKANKKRNKLKRDLDYVFEVESEISPKLFKEFSQVHKDQQAFMKNQLNRQKRRSHFNDEKLTQFIKAVSTIKDRSLIFLIRNRDQELIFYRYCYQDQDKLYSWNSAYNHKYHNYNLSDVAILEMIEYLENQTNFTQLDLGAGGYAWKFRWTKKFISLYKYENWLNKNFTYKLFKARKSL